MAKSMGSFRSSAWSSKIEASNEIRKVFEVIWKVGRRSESADFVRNCHRVFGYNCALMECGVLGRDDFSPAAGAGAEEDKRDKSEEKAGHFFDVGFWMLGFGLGKCRADFGWWMKQMLNFGFWILKGGGRSQRLASFVYDSYLGILDEGRQTL